MDEDTKTNQNLLSLLHAEFFEASPLNGFFRTVPMAKMSGKANIFIGVRRSGKTFCLYQLINDLIAARIQKSQILYLNFEDDRLPVLDAHSLGRLLDSFYSLFPKNHEQTAYFFLDEIQNVKNWSKVVRRYLDRKNCHIYISGSSAKLLSTEIATEMRGRSLTHEIFPLSMQESFAFLDQNWPKSTSPRARDVFAAQAKSYLNNGGFPEVQRVDSRLRREILQGYVDTVVVRDIIERHHITGMKILRYLVSNLILNTGRLFSANKFFNDAKSQGMKVGKNTVYDYLSYLEDAYLIFSVPLLSDSIRKQESNPRKVYCVDPGLATAYTLGLNKDLGKLFETMIYLDLRRMGHKINYFKTKEGFEVDFVTESPGGKRFLLQACVSAENAETKEREIRALNVAEKELGMTGHLVTLDSYAVMSDLFME